VGKQPHAALSGDLFELHTCPRGLSHQHNGGDLGHRIQALRVFAAALDAAAAAAWVRRSRLVGRDVAEAPRGAHPALRKTLFHLGTASVTSNYEQQGEEQLRTKVTRVPYWLSLAVKYSSVEHAPRE